MTMENYPKTISNPPAEVAGHRVLAWAEKRRSEGYYPNGVVLAVRSTDLEYVVWNAYTKDGGESWHADTGHYTHDHDDAWNAFVNRCKIGLAES